MSVLPPLGVSPWVLAAARDRAASGNEAAAGAAARAAYLATAGSRAEPPPLQRSALTARVASAPGGTASSGLPRGAVGGAAAVRGLSFALLDGAAAERAAAGAAAVRRDGFGALVKARRKFAVPATAVQARARLHGGGAASEQDASVTPALQAALSNVIASLAAAPAAPFGFSDSSFVAPTNLAYLQAAAPLMRSIAALGAILASGEPLTPIVLSGAAVLLSSSLDASLDAASAVRARDALQTLLASYATELSAPGTPARLAAILRTAAARFDTIVNSGIASASGRAQNLWAQSLAQEAEAAGGQPADTPFHAMKPPSRPQSAQAADADPGVPPPPGGSPPEEGQGPPAPPPPAPRGHRRPPGHPGGAGPALDDDDGDEDGLGGAPQGPRPRGRLPGEGRWWGRAPPGPPADGLPPPPTNGDGMGRLDPDDLLAVVAYAPDAVDPAAAAPAGGRGVGVAENVRAFMEGAQAHGRSLLERLRATFIRRRAGAPPLALEDADDGDGARAPMVPGGHGLGDALAVEVPDAAAPVAPPVARAFLERIYSLLGFVPPPPPPRGAPPSDLWPRVPTAAPWVHGDARLPPPPPTTRPWRDGDARLPPAPPMHVPPAPRPTAAAAALLQPAWWHPPPGAAPRTSPLPSAPPEDAPDHDDGGVAALAAPPADAPYPSAPQAEPEALPRGWYRLPDAARDPAAATAAGTAALAALAAAGAGLRGAQRAAGAAIGGGAAAVRAAAAGVDLAHRGVRGALGTLAATAGAVAQGVATLNGRAQAAVERATEALRAAAADEEAARQLRREAALGERSRQTLAWRGGLGGLPLTQASAELPRPGATTPGGRPAPAFYPPLGAPPGPGAPVQGRGPLLTPARATAAPAPPGTEPRTTPAPVTPLPRKRERDQEAALDDAERLTPPSSRGRRARSPPAEPLEALERVVESGAAARSRAAAAITEAEEVVDDLRALRALFTRLLRGGESIAHLIALTQAPLLVNGRLRFPVGTDIPGDLRENLARLPEELRPAAFGRGGHPINYTNAADLGAGDAVTQGQRRFTADALARTLLAQRDNLQRGTGANAAAGDRLETQLARLAQGYTDGDPASEDEADSEPDAVAAGGGESGGEGAGGAGVGAATGAFIDEGGDGAAPRGRRSSRAAREAAPAAAGRGLRGVATNQGLDEEEAALAAGGSAQNGFGTRQGEARAAAVSPGGKRRVLPPEEAVPLRRPPGSPAKKKRGGGGLLGAHAGGGLLLGLPRGTGVLPKNLGAPSAPRRVPTLFNPRTHMALARPSVLSAF